MSKKKFGVTALNIFKNVIINGIIAIDIPLRFNIEVAIW